jgi:hypothetical protein
MSSRFGRTLLMSAASALVLAAGPVLAEDGVGLGVGVGTDAGVGAAVGTDAKALLGVDSTASVGDVVHTSETGAGADAVADAEANAKLAAEAGEQGSIEAEGAAAASADITAMTLAEFSGKRLHDGSGAAIGTVEAVAVDADSELYLVTALDAFDEDGQERLIPLDEVAVDAVADALVMAQGSAEAVAQMDDFAAVASAYSLVDTDAKLQALLAAD